LFKNEPKSVEKSDQRQKLVLRQEWASALFNPSTSLKLPQNHSLPKPHGMLSSGDCF